MQSIATGASAPGGRTVASPVGQIAATGLHRRAPTAGSPPVPARPARAALRARRAVTPNDPRSIASAASRSTTEPRRTRRSAVGGIVAARQPPDMALVQRAVRRSSDPAPGARLAHDAREPSANAWSATTVRNTPGASAPARRARRTLRPRERRNRCAAGGRAARVHAVVREVAHVLESRRRRSDRRSARDRRLERDARAVRRPDGVPRRPARRARRSTRPCRGTACAGRPDRLRQPAEAFHWPSTTGRPACRRGARPPARRSSPSDAAAPPRNPPSTARGPPGRRNVPGPASRVPRPAPPRPSGPIAPPRGTPWDRRGLRRPRTTHLRRRPRTASGTSFPAETGAARPRRRAIAGRPRACPRPRS